MLTKQHQIQAAGKEEYRDPRIGKRVICCSLLPTITLLGTVQRVLHYANGEEYWHVLTDGPMTEEAPASSFLVYDGPEFPAGARVRYRVGEWGCWRATVLGPKWTLNHLRYLIRVDTSELAAVTVRRGHTFAAHPTRLSLICAPPQTWRRNRPHA
ncbi:MAG TPA: hypothetical protein VKY19_29565 [Ktedonosporobacter sp.]|jgi:hypothetical protein|nr:hypothetical protein [Ktedonosporobacter sp.]